MDYAYQGKHQPTKLAIMTIASNAYLAQEQPWLVDNVATDHVTSSPNQLSFPKPYNGQDHLTVGNGRNLPITHIDNTLIPSSYATIHLNIVLRVPSISSNLASINKICHDNKCWYYFNENIISIQALTKGKVLYQGKNEDGVYPIYPHKASQLTLSSKVCNNATKPIVFNKTLWHMRLGHPHDQVLKLLFPDFKFELNKYTDLNHSCTHCLYGKMHNLPFPKSQFIASSSFELIHSDVQGPAPMQLVNGFRYYVLFVDHFIRFTWIYQIKSESSKMC